MLVPELTSRVHGDEVPEITIFHECLVKITPRETLTSGLDAVHEPVAGLAFCLAGTNNVCVNHCNGIGATRSNIGRVIDSSQSNLGLGLDN